MKKYVLKAAICWALIICVIGTKIHVYANDNNESHTDELAIFAEGESLSLRNIASIQIDYIGADSYNIMYGATVVNSDGVEFIGLKTGIYKVSQERQLLTEDAAENLNIAKDVLYYSLLNNNSEIKGVDTRTGETKYEHLFDELHINQMYVINNEAFFVLSEGNLFIVRIDTSEIKQITFDNDIKSFSPTPFGVVYAKGDLLDYSIYINNRLLEKHVNEYWVEDNILVIKKEGEEQRIVLAPENGIMNNSYTMTTYNNSSKDVSLETFLSDICSVDEGIAGGALCVVEKNESEAFLSSNVAIRAITSSLQETIRIRANDVYNYTWKTLKDVKGFRIKGTSDTKNNTVYAGTTVHGIIYGQPVTPDNSYVLFNCPFSQYKQEVNNPYSRIYTEKTDEMATVYNYGNIYTSPYYSTDCSAFVSYCWGFANRAITSTLATEPEISKYETNFKGIQVGDALVSSGHHAILVTDIYYDTNGKICKIETIEQTEPFTKKSVYQSVSDMIDTIRSDGLVYNLYREKSNPGNTKITLSANSISLFRGEKTQLTITNCAPGGKISWSSDNPAVASVDNIW